MSPSRLEGGQGGRELLPKRFVLNDHLTSLLLSMVSLEALSLEAQF